MRTLERLEALLPPAVGTRLRGAGEALTEVRLRANRPVQLRTFRGDELLEDVISPEALSRVLAALMDYSVYAREDELGQGFFTMADGCRVGVCGRAIALNGRVTGMGGIGSACVRISREVRGCADALVDAMLAENGGAPASTLILSAPGMGKTTCLREVARRLSDGGFCVGVSDERHEIAACVNGVPTLDVGSRTDVMDGCPKHIAIPQLMRACAPGVIVADEIGGASNAEALADAVRCGAAVVASAHAGSIDDAFERPSLREAMSGGTFKLAVLLSGKPGRVSEIRKL